MARVGNRQLFALVTLVLGIPYLLVAVALDGFDAAFVAWARVALAAVVMVVVIGPRTLVRSLRRRPVAIVVFSVAQFTIPMFFIARAEVSVPSSLVACLIATEPLWIVLMSRRDPARRIGVRGVLGMLAGLVGVGLLLGVELGGGLGGAALTLGAAAAYAIASLMIPRLTTEVPAHHLVATGLVVAAVTLLPLVAVAPPDALPGPGPIAALIGLAVVCTAIAFPLWFALIVRIGPARASLVTYTSPVVAVVLGVALLDEQLGRLAPVGLALILAGSWLASRARATPAPSSSSPGRVMSVDFYDTELRAHNDRLRAATNIRPGERVLDIGCGAGQSTRDAARQAAPGLVLGVDLSERLLDRARELTAAEGLGNVTFEHGDAQVHPFSCGPYDLVISRFGCMFFDDAVAAFSHVARAMRPDGRLVLLVWQSRDDNAWASAVASALSQPGRAAVPPPIDPFSWGSRATATDVLGRAGFDSVTFEDVREPVYYGHDVATALANVCAFSQHALAGLSPADAALTMDRLRDTLADHHDESGVTFESRAWLVTARRSPGAP